MFFWIDLKRECDNELSFLTVKAGFEKFNTFVVLEAIRDYNFF